TRPRTARPHCGGAFFALAFVYASLEPFQPWLAPVPDTPFFLFSPWSGRWLRYDMLLNVVAYLPFGFFVGLSRRGASPAKRIVTSVVIGAAISFTMEWMQMYIPS